MSVILFKKINTKYIIWSILHTMPRTKNKLKNMKYIQFKIFYD